VVKLSRFLSLILIAGAAGSLLAGVIATRRASATGPDTWTPTGDANVARTRPQMVALTNGKVLLVGAWTDGFGATLLSSEIYDPGSGTWSNAASLPFPAGSWTNSATLLLDGRVLVTGTSFDGGTILGQVAAVYDPATDSWSSGGSPSAGRIEYTATRLNDGRVLVAGGADNAGFLLSAEIYDPATNTWSGAAAMHAAHSRHAAALTGGKVLVSASSDWIGGATLPELYNPATNTWTQTGGDAERQYGTATTLADGRVLMAGGSGSYGQGAVYAQPSLYDPATNAFTPAGTIAVRREHASATLLSNGLVLLAGGETGGTSTTNATEYNPATNAWSTVAAMNVARSEHGAVLLADGRVLVAGGNPATATTEIYEAGAPPPPDTVTSTPTATGTATATDTPTPCAGPCPTPTNSPTGTATFTPTNSPVPTFAPPVRDHKTDANGDGYSAADEQTIANCGLANCAFIMTFGTAETNTCKDGVIRHCGTPGAPADDSVPVRGGPPPADGYGCDVALDTIGPNTTTKLAQSDVDLDGAVSILDLATAASWFANAVDASGADPRWEGNLDGDGLISILDLSAMATNFGRSVAGDCQIE
jgi:hypothetical protein